MLTFFKKKIHIRNKGEVGTIQRVYALQLKKYWPFQCGASFVDPFCYLCFVFVMLSCLFIAALWSFAGKGLTSWLSCVWCFLVFLSLSLVVSWVRCGTWLYRFLTFTLLLTLKRISMTNTVLCKCSVTDVFKPHRSVYVEYQTCEILLLFL